MRIVGEVRPGDWSYTQVFNILIRETFRHLNLKQLGRNYYDPSDATLCPQYKLEIWPGYITSIRNHEHEMLMCVDQGMNQFVIPLKVGIVLSLHNHYFIFQDSRSSGPTLHLIK